MYFQVWPDVYIAGSRGLWSFKVRTKTTLETVEVLETNPKKHNKHCPGGNKTAEFTYFTTNKTSRENKEKSRTQDIHSMSIDYPFNPHDLSR